MRFSIRIGQQLPVLALIRVLFNVSVFQRTYLDAGLSQKRTCCKTGSRLVKPVWNYWNFLKNDIKLIKRNKRSKTTVGLSVMFLLVLFFTNSIRNV
jgi:hypothetical protein